MGVRLAASGILLIVDVKPGGKTLEGLVDELARVLSDIDEAKVLVLRAGFPPGSVPSCTTSQAFWTRVVQDAANGRLVGGVQALVDEVAKQYPGNAVFASHRAEAAPAPSAGDRASHTQAEQPKGRALWKLKLEGELELFSEDDKKAVLELLMRVSGDLSLKLVQVAPGSVVLLVDASRRGATKLQQLVESGTLESIGKWKVLESTILEHGVPEPADAASLSTKTLLAVGAIGLVVTLGLAAWGWSIATADDPPVDDPAVVDPPADHGSVLLPESELLPESDRPRSELRDCEAIEMVVKDWGAENCPERTAVEHSVQHAGTEPEIAVVRCIHIETGAAIGPNESWWDCDPEKLRTEGRTNESGQNTGWENSYGPDGTFERARCYKPGTGKPLRIETHKAQVVGKTCWQRSGGQSGKDDDVASTHPPTSEDDVEETTGPKPTTEEPPTPRAEQWSVVVPPDLEKSDELILQGPEVSVDTMLVMEQRAASGGQSVCRVTELDGERIHCRYRGNQSVHVGNLFQRQ